MKEVEELTAQLRKQQQQSQQTVQELEQLRKVHIVTNTHTQTRSFSNTTVSEGLSSQATGLVMAGLQLQQQPSLRKRANLAHSTGTAIAFPLAKTSTVQKCTWKLPEGLMLSCAHIQIRDF